MVEARNAIRGALGNKRSQALNALSASLTKLGEADRGLSWNWGPANSLDEVGFYHEGHFVSAGKTLSAVAAASPRMGMVAAALLSMKMIMRFRPRLLAMIGICAGVKSECAIGDVLVADPSWDWQMGKFASAGFSFAPDQIDVALEVTQCCTQLADDKQLWFDIHRSFSGKRPPNIPELKIGAVASGSAVLADVRLLNEIKEQHRKLLGVEMELYGVYAAGRDCSPPHPIVFGLKSVSDYADDSKNDDFQPYSAHVSAHALAALCERYAGNLCRHVG